MLKNWIAALCLGLAVTIGTGAAAASPAEEMPQISQPLYGMPCVGFDDASLYYLDTTSCYAVTDGNTATVGGLIYGATRSLDGDGNPEEMTPYTVTYKTWTEGGERIIHVDSILLADGTKMEQWPDSAQFFYDLFWKIADHTWIRGSL